MASIQPEKKTTSCLHTAVESSCSKTDLHSVEKVTGGIEPEMSDVQALVPTIAITQRVAAPFSPFRLSWQGDIFLTREQADFHAHAIEEIRQLIGHHASRLDNETSQFTGLYTKAHALEILKRAVAANIKHHENPKAIELVENISRHLSEKNALVSDHLQELLTSLRLDHYSDIDDIYKDNKSLVAFIGYLISIASNTEEIILSYAPTIRALYADFLIASEVSYDTQWAYCLEKEKINALASTYNMDNTEISINRNFPSPNAITTGRIWIWATSFSHLKWDQPIPLLPYFNPAKYDQIIIDANRSDFITCLFSNQAQQATPLTSQKLQERPPSSYSDNTDHYIESLKSRLPEFVNPSDIIFGEEYEYWLDSDSSQYNDDIPRLKTDFELTLRQQLRLHNLNEKHLKIVINNYREEIPINSFSNRKDPAPEHLDFTVSISDFKYRVFRDGDKLLNTVEITPLPYSLHSQYIIDKQSFNVFDCHDRFILTVCKVLELKEKSGHIHVDARKTIACSISVMWRLFLFFQNAWWLPIMLKRESRSYSQFPYLTQLYAERPAILEQYRSYQNDFNNMLKTIYQIKQGDYHPDLTYFSQNLLNYSDKTMPIGLTHLQPPPDEIEYIHGIPVAETTFEIRVLHCPRSKTEAIKRCIFLSALLNKLHIDNKNRTPLPDLELKNPTREDISTEEIHTHFIKVLESLALNTEEFMELSHLHEQQPMEMG